MSMTGIGGVNPVSSRVSGQDDREKNTRQEAAGTTSFAGLLDMQDNAPAAGGTAQTQAASMPDPVREFLEYMQKPPEERLQEAWLRQHGISPEEWEAMPAEEKQALMDQMKQDIETKLQQAAEARERQGKPHMLLAFGLGL